MIKLKSLLESKTIMSEAMQYHHDNKISITENIFRVQSDASFNLIVEARKMYDTGNAWFEGRDKELFETTDIGRFGTYEGKRIPLDYPMEIPLSEAEYQGKKVSLGKPTKGGRKKYQVYVRNKKGNVIKISYGDSGMKANWNDPEARKSFAARHQCHLKKDRTTAGYWACRAHKDFGRNVSGRFW
jgi:hypothetical protein